MPDADPANLAPNAAPNAAKAPTGSGATGSGATGDGATKPASKRFIPAPLPVLLAPLTPAQILDRLDKASRRGKLAGFRRSDTPDRPFHIEVFGKYFDRRLLVTMSSDSVASPDSAGASAPPAGNTSTTLRFENRVKHSRICIFWFVILISIWPGVSLTDSILATYFDWYPREFWVTCAWYLPLAIAPVPWMWLTAWRQSAVIADAEARESIARIAAHVGASSQPSV